VIQAIVRRHGLCDADAADVAQATWLKLLDQLDYLRDPGPPRRVVGYYRAG
jgi:DNA-directed RNA polymerase specialized sigma24 family protein